MPRHKPFEIRFWDKVKRKHGNECWLWAGKKSAAGYGVVYCGTCSRMAHRVAYELFYGIMVSPEINVCHDCDTPACVRPDHLFLGTQSDNMQDMARKGRSYSQTHREEISARLALVRVRPPVGEKHHLARLTDEKVRYIRALRSTGMKYEDIALEVGVGKSTVGRVVNEDSRGGWAHVE